MIRSLDEQSFIFTYILDESRRIRSYSHHLISIDRSIFLFDIKLVSKEEEEEEEETFDGARKGAVT